MEPWDPRLQPLGQDERDRIAEAERKATELGALTDDELRAEADRRKVKVAASADRDKLIAALLAASEEA